MYLCTICWRSLGRKDDRWIVICWAQVSTSQWGTYRWDPKYASVWPVWGYCVDWCVQVTAPTLTLWCVWLTSATSWLELVLVTVGMAGWDVGGVNDQHSAATCPIHPGQRAATQQGVSGECQDHEHYGYLLVCCCHVSWPPHQPVCVCACMKWVKLVPIWFSVCCVLMLCGVAFIHT